MSKKNIILLSVSSILCFLGGVIADRLVKDFPLLSFDNSVGLVDAASLLVTIAIGILVPFLLKRWIDDSRQAKGYVVEELREFIHDINELPDLTKQLFFSGKITQEDKTRINATFETIDIKLSNLLHELEDFYSKETKPLRENLNSSYIEYWKFLTGSEIMSTKFKSIDETFYKKATGLYLNIETRVKDIIRMMYS